MSWGTRALYIAYVSTNLGSDDHTIKIWSFDKSITVENDEIVRPPVLKHTLRGHLTNIIDISISKDNHLMVSIDLDNALILWCMKTGQPLVSFIGSIDNRTTNGICLITSHENHVSENYVRGFIVVSTQGLGIFSIPYIHVHKNCSDEFDLPGKCCHAILLDSVHFSQEISSSFDVSPAGLTIAGGTEKGEVEIFKAEKSGKLITKIDVLKGIHTGPVDNLSISPNELNIVSACHKDNTMAFWSLNKASMKNSDNQDGNSLWSGIKLHLTRKPKSQTCLIGWSYEGKYLFVSFRSGLINLYRGIDGKFLGALNGHEAQVNALTGSAIKDNILISGGFDGRIITWNLETKEKINEYKYPGASLTTAGGLIWIDETESTEESKNHQKITGLISLPAELGFGYVAITKAGLISTFNPDSRNRSPEVMKITERQADEQFLHWEFDNAQVLKNQKFFNQINLSEKIRREIEFPDDDEVTEWMSSKSKKALGEMPSQVRFPTSFCYRTLYSTAGNGPRQNRQDSTSIQNENENAIGENFVPLQDLEDYKRTSYVTFEVLHALSQVPFSLLPPGYLVDLRGNPYSYERQKYQIPGRNVLNRIIDLTPTVTFDDTSLVQVVDDIHYTRDVMPVGYPYNVRIFRGVPPIENKRYLWQTIWTKKDYSLLDLIVKEELEECLREIEEDFNEENRLINRARSFLKKQKNVEILDKKLVEEKKSENPNEFETNQETVAVYDPTFEEPDVSSDSSVEWNKGDSVDFECWINRPKRKRNQDQNNNSENENNVSASSHSQHVSTNSDDSGSTSSSSDDSSYTSSGSDSSKLSQNLSHENDDNQRTRRSKRQKKLNHLRRKREKKKPIPVFVKTSQENSQDVPDIVEINKREQLKLRIMCNLDYANLFSKSLPLDNPPIGGYSGFLDNISKSDTESVDIPMTRNRSKVLHVEESKSEDAPSDKILPDWPNKILWSGPDLDWLNTIEPQPEPYLPQLNDRIFFIHEGYQHYITNFWDAGVLLPVHCPMPPKEWMRIYQNYPNAMGIVQKYEEPIPDEIPLPWEGLDSFPPALECVVESINFTFLRMTNKKKTALRNQRWKRHDRFVQRSLNQPSTSSSMANFAYTNMEKFENEIHQMTNSFIRVLTLKLQRQDTMQSFYIRYHQDTEQSCNFLVLHQAYQAAMNRKWNRGSKFLGIRKERTEEGDILDVKHANKSHWLSIKVKWCIDESEAWLSPWEIFPFSKANLLKNRVLDSVSILNIYGSLDMMPSTSKDLSESNKLGIQDLERLAKCFIKILECEKFDEFREAVDLSLYPDYLVMCPYLVDLSLIINRIQTGFYRCRDGIIFDVMMLARNVLSYNRAQSQIARKAILLSNLCLKLIFDCSKDATYIDEFLENWSGEHISERTLNTLLSENSESANVSTISFSDAYTERTKQAKFDSESEIFENKDEHKENEDPEESPLVTHRTRSKVISYFDQDTESDEHEDRNESRRNSLKISSSPKKKDDIPLRESQLRSADSSTRSNYSNRVNNHEQTNDDWRQRAINLTKSLIKKPQSEFFLNPVDTDMYSDYLDVISQPMSLSEVMNRLTRPRSRIHGPDVFIGLLNLIVSNCRTYNTTPNTKILEDCDWFEDYINSTIIPQLNGEVIVSKRKSLKKPLIYSDSESNSDQDNEESQNQNDDDDYDAVEDDEDNDDDQNTSSHEDEDSSDSGRQGYRLRPKRSEPPKLLRTSSGRVIKQIRRDHLYELEESCQQTRRSKRVRKPSRRVMSQNSDSSASPPYKKRSTRYEDDDSDYGCNENSNHRASRRSRRRH